MKIDPKSNSPASFLRPAGGLETDSSTPASESAKVVFDATAFVPTSTLIGLLGQVQRLPDTRDDVINQVRDRLAKGDLLSRAASTEAAQAILGIETSEN